MATYEPVINLPDEQQLKAIEEELGESKERMNNRIELIKEWLKFQEHLPNEIDENLLKNFVRLCKFDVTKAKMKLESYFVSRERYDKFYDHRKLKEDFEKYNCSNVICYLPSLTREGYRVIVIRPWHADEFDFLANLQYGTILFDYLLHYDVSSAVVIVYDLAHVSASLMTKLDLIAFRDYLRLYIDFLPFRINSLHILNLHPLATPAVAVIKAIVGAKIKDRLIVHKTPEDLYRHVPKEVLPSDLGGSSDTIESIGLRWENFLLNNRDLRSKMEMVKLTGPIPDKEHLRMEGFGVDGSFRRLQID